MSGAARTGAGPARAGALGLPKEVTAGLFDLDGVLTNTAAAHDKAWKEMFDAFLWKWAERTGEPFLPFDPVTDYATYVDGKPRPDGVRRPSRCASALPLPERPVPPGRHDRRPTRHHHRTHQRRHHHRHRPARTRRLRPPPTRPSDRRRVLVDASTHDPRQAFSLFDDLLERTAQLSASYTDDQLTLLLELLDRFRALIADHTTTLRAQAANKQPTNSSG